MLSQKTRTALCFASLGVLIAVRWAESSSASGSEPHYQLRCSLGSDDGAPVIEETRDLDGIRSLRDDLLRRGRITTAHRCAIRTLQ